MFRQEINPDLAEIRPVLRKFTDEMLEPIAQEIDRTHAVPARAFDVLREHGYLGMRLPQEFGGGGYDLLTYCLALEEFSRAHRVFTLILDSTSGLNPIAIAKFGRPDQKDRYVRKLATGEITAAFALTEPGAGSDSQSIRTQAKKVDGGWLLNGLKHWISGADKADLILVLAVNDSTKRAKGGITAFLVEKTNPGFHVNRVDTTMGSEAIKLAEISFDDCFVKDTDVLGEVGFGFKVAMESLNSGRLGVACSCIGAAQRLLEMSIDHAKNRETFGEPLSERQSIQWMLAESETELSVARALTYESLRRTQLGQDIGTSTSMSKLYCSEMVGRVADRAVQIHGGMGIVKGYPVERFYRDIRHYRIGEGASEIQKMMIARDLLK